MIFPELKSITSPDLSYGLLPADAEDCSILIELEIGPKGQKGSEVFSFTSVTPRSLAVQTEQRWGRGLLIMDKFSWQAVEYAVARLLAHCSGQTWHEVASKLNKELLWEFDNYQVR